MVDLGEKSRSRNVKMGMKKERKGRRGRGKREGCGNLLQGLKGMSLVLLVTVAD